VAVVQPSRAPGRVGPVHAKFLLGRRRGLVFFCRLRPDKLRFHNVEKPAAMKQGPSYQSQLAR